MLIEFTLGNCLSFKDVHTFSMLAANISDPIEHNPVFSHGKNRLVKTAVIYGPNASGKTNLIKAMTFMKNFVLTSAVNMYCDQDIVLENFRLNSDSANEPCLLEIIFYEDSQRYRYGFMLNGAKVVNEWLYHVPKSREAKLFTRQDNNISISPQFKEARGLESKTRSTSLFLSLSSLFNGPISTRLVNWFKRFNIVSNLHNDYQNFSLYKLMHDQDYAQKILEFLQIVDLGVDGITVDSGLPRNNIMAQHKKYNSANKTVGSEHFSLINQESEGTRKLFELSAPIIDTLNNGSIVVVDELGSGLHPLVTKYLINLFHSPTTNVKNAQLIFTTHDTNLLTNRLFRRDQIWFTEKNRYGATDLYSLAEYKISRAKLLKDSALIHDYIHGRYGAIPLINDCMVQET